MDDPSGVKHEPVTLRAFLETHEAACPVCGYNLRQLQGEACPECGRELRLGVVATTPPLGSLISALVASSFCVPMAGVFFLTLLLGESLSSMFRYEPVAASGLVFSVLISFALFVLLTKRKAFLKLPPDRQRRVSVSVVIAVVITYLMVFVPILN